MGKKNRVILYILIYIKEIEWTFYVGYNEVSL